MAWSESALLVSAEMFSKHPAFLIRSLKNMRLFDISFAYFLKDSVGPEIVCVAGATGEVSVAGSCEGWVDFITQFPEKQIK